MDEWDLKLRAFDAAHAEGLKGPDATKRAQEIYDWVRGRDEQSSTVGGGKAEVVGRDGMLKRPYGDYLMDG